MQIFFGIHKFGKCDISICESKERLIDCFVNSVFLFDDWTLMKYDFKESATKITFDDIGISDFGVQKIPPNKSVRR